MSAMRKIRDGDGEAMASPEPMSAHELDELARMLGWRTPSALAKILGVDRATAYRWLTGAVRVPPAVALLMRTWAER